MNIPKGFFFRQQLLSLLIDLTLHLEFNFTKLEHKFINDVDLMSNKPHIPSLPHDGVAPP